MDRTFSEYAGPIFAVSALAAIWFTIRFIGGYNVSPYDFEDTCTSSKIAELGRSTGDPEHAEELLCRPAELSERLTGAGLPALACIAIAVFAGVRRRNEQQAAASGAADRSQASTSQPNALPPDQSLSASTHASASLLIQQPASQDAIADELTKLAELRESGALSDAEFAAHKDRLLGK